MATEHYNYSHLIGSHLEVGYLDQNESFAEFSPRGGRVTRQVALEDWGSDWLVLNLEAPFEYQLGSLDSGFRGIQVGHFLVRSRRVGCPIGAMQTPVFVLIHPNAVLDTKTKFRSADFVQVCWGIIPAKKANRTPHRKKAGK